VSAGMYRILLELRCVAAAWQGAQTDTAVACLMTGIHWETGWLNTLQDSKIFVTNLKLYSTPG